MIARFQMWLAGIAAIFAAFWLHGFRKKKEGAEDERRKIGDKDADAVRKALDARIDAIRRADGDGLRVDDGFKRD